MKLRGSLYLTFCLGVASASESRLANISVLANAGSESETLIVGFAISGHGPKQIVLRGVGPSLAPYGVTKPVADPTLALYSGATLLDKNDNWGGAESLATTFKALGAFPLPKDSTDAALVKSLNPGNYTAHLLSPGAKATGLVECYDADDANSEAFLTNVSARCAIGAAGESFTVGFVITGTAAKTVMIRGIGPALAAYGLTNALKWPELKLFNGDGTAIGDNYAWAADVTPRSLFDYVGAFSLPIGSYDSVLFLALPPGQYTAQLTGIASTTGTALIEVYAVDNSPVPFITLQPVSAEALNPPVDDGSGFLATGPDASPQMITPGSLDYPQELWRAGIVGEVLVDFYVKTDGTAANAVAIRATDARFGAAAVAGISACIFSPAKKSGRLVTAHVQQNVWFKLYQ